MNAVTIDVESEVRSSTDRVKRPTRAQQAVAVRCGLLDMWRHALHLS